MNEPAASSGDSGSPGSVPGWDHAVSARAAEMRSSRDAPVVAVGVLLARLPEALQRREPAVGARQGEAQGNGIAATSRTGLLVLWRRHSDWAPGASGRAPLRTT